MLAEWPRKAEGELKVLSIFLSENGQERLAGGSGEEEGTEGLASVIMWSLAFCAEFSGFSRLFFPFFPPDFLDFPSFSSIFFRTVAASCGRRNFFLCDF
jgi:hypothetical protein